MHEPNVIPRDVIVRAVSVLVVLVAIINELRSYLGFFKKCDRNTDRHTDRHKDRHTEVVIELLCN